MSGRQVDWDVWLNRLIFCHGCGRFAMPKDRQPPNGWKLLYQPHPEGRPGLHSCSLACEERLKEAMKKGPIVEPLEMRPPPMPLELQQQVTELVRGVAQDAVNQALIEAIESSNGKVWDGEAESVDGTQTRDADRGGPPPNETWHDGTPSSVEGKKEPQRDR